MIRMVLTVGVLLALHAGCSKKEAEPRVATKDPSTAAKADTQPAAPRISDERAQRALEVMADPQSKTDQGPGLAAMLLVDAWLKQGPDEAARQRTSKALERVIAEGSTYMRTTAYDLLAHYALPDAERILIAEVENPSRDEHSTAGVALGQVIKDFAQIRAWIRDDQPFHWEAALSMMRTFRTFDKAEQEQRWPERRTLLIELGKRPDLPGNVVYSLAEWFELYLDEDPADAQILQLAERWSKHPDDMAAQQMKKAVYMARIKRETR